VLKGTALSRAKRSGLLRNAALILGERREELAVPVLIERLRDSDPIVRSASAWALGQIATHEALDALRNAQDDMDLGVRDTISRALRTHEKDRPTA
jgi:epoxyqueuosine reductase